MMYGSDKDAAELRGAARAIDTLYLEFKSTFDNRRNANE
jgi:hypothetical protein